MDLNIQRYIDSKDITKLRDIFTDSFEIDPTFENYKEEFEASKKIEGFFENHHELTEIKEKVDFWNKEYWYSLKKDLIKNFSEKRFSHMLSVAKIVFKEKVERLQAERASKRNTIENKPKEKKVNTSEAQSKNISNRRFTTIDKNKEEEERIAKLRIEYEKKHKEQQEQIKKEQEMQKRVGIINSEQKNSKGNHWSKKALGIALVIATIVVMKNQGNPQEKQKNAKDTTKIDLATDSMKIHQKETMIQKASQTMEIATNTVEANP